MMRVTRIERHPGELALHVKGRLTRDTADELASECALVLPQHRDVDLDLAALQFADAAGIALLRRLAARGIRLHNCSPLVTALLGDGAPSGESAPSASQSGPPDADDALVAALQRGDGDAFELLVRRHGPRLLATARRLLRDEQDGRDAVQDALLAAFRSLDTFRGSARLATWLHRIVVNAALMKIRRRRSRREESIDALLPRFDDTGHFATAVMPWTAGAEVLLERQETRTRVRAAIAQLPERYRTVLLLRDIEELDTGEAAVALGISANAVKIRLHRARQALRTLLARDIDAQADPACGAAAAAEETP